jgi:hypothetical protein
MKNQDKLVFRRILETTENLWPIGLIADAMLFSLAS